MGEQEQENSINDIRKFLNTPENPISMQEFSEFWKSLSDEEKAAFKAEELPES
jgi:hypothetical protein